MQKLTDGELDVMRILWEHGELKPAEIIERFPRPIKNPAIRSFLSVLVRKGHVIRSKRGKAYYYKARTQAEPALNSLLRRTIEVFFKGSTEALLCRLIRSEKLTEEQLLQLKRMAEGGEDGAAETPKPETLPKRKRQGK